MDHEGRKVRAGIYETAVSIQDDETFFLPTNAIVHLYLQKKRNPALFAKLCLLLQSKIPCYLCYGLQKARAKCELCRFDAHQVLLST